MKEISYCLEKQAGFIGFALKFGVNTTVWYA
jgi:hypothetical protein